ncbi:MAG TPA: SDR family NAD(P)-dependent oxidoreductase [Anaerolineae bacterium]|nr:SDR family NAD(P)-dependent oxidoreductase [Anaerolineae bacterium]
MDKNVIAVSDSDDKQFNLKGVVALVTGASRGIGRGIAIGLGEAGATVYVTGRTEVEGQAVMDVPGTIHQTAAEVTAAGGQGVALRCDHRRDADVRKVFARIQEEQGVLDVLINNVWGGFEDRIDEHGEYTWPNPFWEQPLWRWESMFQAGVRAHYVASSLAVPLMLGQKSGVIVHISDGGLGWRRHNLMYDLAKGATDLMAREMAQELRGEGIAVVALHPGAVRTELVMKEGRRQGRDTGVEPVVVGRLVAALVADEQIMGLSGQVLTARELGVGYGFGAVFEGEDD